MRLLLSPAYPNPTIMFKEVLAYWWIYVLRGVLAILFGLACTMAPLITLALLAFWAGAFILADGVVGLIGTFANWKQLEDKWLLVLEAGLNILIGYLIIRMPDATVLALVLMMAIWAVLAGVVRVAMAVRVRKEIKGEGWLILSGLLSVAFGVLLFAVPAVGLVTLALILGMSALVIGGVLIIMGLRFRKLHRSGKHRLDRTAP